jgi:hypothetical protein
VSLLLLALLGLLLFDARAYSFSLFFSFGYQLTETGSSLGMVSLMTESPSAVLTTGASVSRAYPNRLPIPKPKLAGPLLLPRVVLLLPPSSSMSMASSPPRPVGPRFPVAFSSLACMTASSARSLLRRTFSLSTASFLTFSTCASRSARAESQRCDHACSVDCSAGSEPGARSRSGATDVTEMSECAGSSVAVMSPA